MMQFCSGPLMHFLSGVDTLVLGLEINPASGVALGFHQPQYVPIEVNRAIEAGYVRLRMPGPQYAGQSHRHLPLCSRDPRHARPAMMRAMSRRIAPAPSPAFSSRV
jgi:hypothetical protein